ncbi:MAG TPA: hypothetical protein VHX17_07725 [Candidatus Cybelea sp.]|jgi:hypothetical protein|nr:hypothetical protein [Candidatus Cybelea sp.]
MIYEAIERQPVCTGKLLFIWSVYGWAMASLSATVHAEGGNDLTSWGLALVVGLGLAFVLGRN